MKLNRTGNSSTEITLDNGTVILFSYDTAVAAFVPADKRYYRTNRFYSRTTSKHLNQFLCSSYGTIEVDPSYFDTLLP